MSAKQIKNKKVISLNQLVKLLNTKSKILKPVLVTGCFDLIHQAHEDFLKTAKNKGNFLIIGLETDKRVNFLKGKGRPFHSWRKRAKNLAKLRSVDMIFSLPEEFCHKQNHLNLLKQIKPKILAVSENTPFLDIKIKLIEKVGGKIFVYPYNKEYSTTNIINNLVTKKQIDC